MISSTERVVVCVAGNGTALLVGKITYSDTGAYMCVAANPAGVTRDITSLIVQDQPTPSKHPPPDYLTRLIFYKQS